MDQIDTNLTFKLDKPSIIVIDNDECIGSWGDMSIFYSLCKIISVHPPSIELFARLIGDTGCVRSGLRELYNYIINLKEKKKILGIYMCTAARNDIGWVLFLKEILEYWYGMPIYDGVIYGNMIESWHAENNSQYMNEYGVIKDMNQIRKIANVPLDTPVIALDDRPHNIKNGYSLSIEPYHVAVNLIEVGRIYIQDWNKIYEEKYGNHLMKNWKEYSLFPFKYTNYHTDKILYQAITCLENIFI